MKYFKVIVSNRVILSGAIVTASMLKQFKALVPNLQYIEIAESEIEHPHWVIKTMADFTGDGERNEFQMLNGETVYN